VLLVVRAQTHTTPRHNRADRDRACEGQRQRQSVRWRRDALAREARAVSGDTVAAFTVHPEGESFAGTSPQWFGPHVFGGILLAQALHAARLTVPPEVRARSLHAYFLSAADARLELRYDVDPVKDGRTASTRAVTASQDGTNVLTMLCSFAADRDGRVYDVTHAEEIPEPSALPKRSAIGPWEFAFVGPSPERADGTRESTHRAWMRMTDALPADAAVHDAVIAFFGDLSWNAASPWDLSGPPDRSRMVSADHAMWFHRPARADEWLFYDVQSLVHAGGRGTIRGVVFDAERKIVCSVAQELQFR
jgi:acyl-CoA thioesterase II